MTDIVERLRRPDILLYQYAARVSDDGAFLREAADEIEWLREVLAMAHDHFLRLQDFIPKNGWPEYDRMNALIEIRTALGEEK